MHFLYAYKITGTVVIQRVYVSPFADFGKGRKIREGREGGRGEVGELVQWYYLVEKRYVYTL